MRATYNLKKLIVLGSASAFALLAVPLVSDYVTSGVSPIVATAQAADDHADSGHSGGHGGGHAASGGAKQYKGGTAGGAGKGGSNKSIEAVITEDDGDDSDRPAWAKGNKELNPHVGSSGNKGGTTKKGVDYGDIYVLLRNDNGSAVTEGGEFFVCLNAECSVTVKTVDGALPEDPAAFPAGYTAANAIPVEFGRMNVARSPTKVISHSLDEALSKVSGDTLVTSITVQILSDGSLVTWSGTAWVAVTDTSKVYTDAIGRLVYYDGTVWKAIDSPLENLALYKAVLLATNTDGDPALEVTNGTLTFEVLPADQLDLAASFIAAASDKTGDLSVDEIMNISKFLGVDDELSALVGSYVYDPDYSGTVVQVLVQTSPTTFELQNVDLGTLTYNALPVVAAPNVGIEEFAQEADDNVTIFEYVHDNSAP